MQSSGCLVGSGITIQNEASVNENVLISGNTIQEIGTPAPGSGGPGITVNLGLGGLATGGGTTNLTIQNNPISNIRNSRGMTIQENQGTTGGGPFPTLFTNISGNTFSGVISGQAGDGTFMRLRRLNGTVKVTQAAPTAAANAAELDDANGFNDPTKISLSGTISYSQGTPPLPPLLFAPGGVERAQDSPVSSLAPQRVSPPASAPAGIENVSPNDADLRAVVAAAKARWIATGLTSEQRAVLDRLQIDFTSLPELYLGRAGSDRIEFDRNAGGHGWFVDPAPHARRAVRRHA